MQIFHTGTGPLAGTEDRFPGPDNPSKMRRSIENAEHVGEYDMLQQQLDYILISVICQVYLLHVSVSSIVTNNVAVAHSLTAEPLLRKERSYMSARWVRDTHPALAVGCGALLAPTPV